MGKTKKPTHMAPRDVRTYTEHLRLRTDNVSTRKAWMMLDGDSVTICNQENGKPAEGSVKLTRKAFERMIAWWQKPQALRKKGTP